MSTTRLEEFFRAAPARACDLLLSRVFSSRRQQNELYEILFPFRKFPTLPPELLAECCNYLLLQDIFSAFALACKPFHAVAHSLHWRDYMLRLSDAPRLESYYGQTAKKLPVKHVEACATAFMNPDTQNVELAVGLRCNPELLVHVERLCMTRRNSGFPEYVVPQTRMRKRFPQLSRIDGAYIGITDLEMLPLFAILHTDDLELLSRREPQQQQQPTPDTLIMRRWRYASFPSLRVLRVHDCRDLVLPVLVKKAVRAYLAQDGVVSKAKKPRIALYDAANMVYDSDDDGGLSLVAKRWL